jgi:transposase InsO family protein
MQVRFENRIEPRLCEAARFTYPGPNSALVSVHTIRGLRHKNLGSLIEIAPDSIASPPKASTRRARRKLTALIERRGKPGMIVSDNGTEFTSNAKFAWAQDNSVVWHFIAPGKPMQNGFCESFNGRMRDELLNESLFLGLDQCPDRDHELGRRLQPATAALSAGLSHTAGLCRQSLRNTRSSAQPRRAPPIACCSTRAPRRKN